MTAAEQAVQQAATHVPAEVRARFETADRLSDEDREAIVEIARAGLDRVRTQAGTRRRHPSGAAGKAAQEPTRTPGPDLKPKAGAGHELSAAVAKAAAHERHHRACAARSAAPSELQSVVRTMKALAASSIGQYEQSVLALAGLLSHRGARIGRLPARSVADDINGGAHRAGPSGG